MHLGMTEYRVPSLGYCDFDIVSTFFEVVLFVVWLYLGTKECRVRVFGVRLYLGSVMHHFGAH